MATTEQPGYRALVDMGSNGIRFSISDLSPPTARILPTVFQDRVGISLYDAQYGSGSKAPIPESTISEVVSSLRHFKTTCDDFGVADNNVRVLATEATREAINSVDFRQRIKSSTGWEVEMLSKEDEGRVGAMGIASSFSSVKGLVMDLGGGSTQLTWMVAENGQVQTASRGAVSLPYGAAAMTRRLDEASSAKHSKKEIAALKDEMRTRLRDAYQSLDVPYALRHEAENHGGFTLYLSGGGFRGWGYLLMSQHHIDPYPIPIINGFQVERSEFLKTVQVQALAEDDDVDVFRVSSRRASQVPAVAFLITVLAEVLPEIKEVRFCQGGVREGALYTSLPAEVRAQPPLKTATLTSAPRSAPGLARVLQDAIPPSSTVSAISKEYTPDLLDAFVNLVYVHYSLPKESRAAAALRCTTTGLLAGVHGVSHHDRAILSLLLCERWGGEASLSRTDTPFFSRLQAIVGHEAAWWARYLGRVAAILADTYPAGYIPNADLDGSQPPRIAFSAAWRHDLGKKARDMGVELTVHVPNSNESLKKSVERVEKVGKKKNWVGEPAWGLRVEANLQVGR
ncbi:Ppx-GppA-domain-containing protein [Xylona heveae TC161]|uniref:Ppx-GppA-domain-containing protein n=1 Tax=Xylona heveae (strain CBS 132557 / TC161) TaxID=1328760 RepID=A0A165GNT5_XYLHT|nr:Ppx-GppA-domain-containing protein [Xylona heveae TC161]KZF22413.1 Ppx-GppA-domain-containing protein [Xylona heveae TC161]